MGKLTDFVSKGVRLIVTDVPQAASAAEGEMPPASASARSRPRPSRTRPRRASPAPRSPADVADFEAVYDEAGIELPAHGYGVDKVAEMLESKRLATLGREVKATAVLAALEAAQVPMRDVIQDAVQRDKALDAFEAAKEPEVQELNARKSEARMRRSRTRSRPCCKSGTPRSRS